MKRLILLFALVLCVLFIFAPFTVNAQNISHAFSLINGCTISHNSPADILDWLDEYGGIVWAVLCLLGAIGIFFSEISRPYANTGSALLKAIGSFFMIWFVGVFIGAFFFVAIAVVAVIIIVAIARGIFS